MILLVTVLLLGLGLGLYLELRDVHRRDHSELRKFVVLSLSALLAAGILLTTFAFVIMWLPGKLICDETVENEVVSPGGLYAATLTAKHCGVLADCSTRVSLRNTDFWANLFGKDELVLVLDDHSAVTMIWTGADSLLLGHEETLVLHQVDSWRQIHISVAVMEKGAAFPGGSSGQD